MVEYVHDKNLLIENIFLEIKIINLDHNWLSNQATIATKKLEVNEIN